MPFLRSFTINAKRTSPFPYSIPAVTFAKNIELDRHVTVFVGDNGCGKSTLLETLALSVNLPLIGGHIDDHAGFEAAAILKPFLDIEWGRQTNKGFFFRAEDFSDFINSVDKERKKIDHYLSDLKGQVDESIIRQMSDSQNYRLSSMRREYGEDMQAFSHGEAYLKIFEARIGKKGIFLLDEPEAALSPLKQLSLLFLIMESVKSGNTQFILATHSPIMMGIPGAAIYEIKEDGMQKVKFEETDHYRITKTFLNNPDHYLRHLKS
jgi:predicted ATPase